MLLGLTELHEDGLSLIYLIVTFYQCDCSYGHVVFSALWQASVAQLSAICSSMVLLINPGLNSIPQ